MKRNDKILQQVNKQMQKRDQADNSLLKQIETFRCDNLLQYPYYPVVAITNHRAQTYVAARSRDTISMYVFKNHNCLRSYNLNSSTLPSRSSISAIMFVKPGKFDDKLIPDDNDSLYLIIGFYSGYIFLVRALNKQIKILKKYNKASSADSSFFSKTMSYLSGSGSSQYNLWQSTTVIKMKMTQSSSPSFLFRNGVLVLAKKVDTNTQDIQKKFDSMISQNIELRNTMNSSDKYTYLACSDYKMIKDNQRCIIGFSSTVSSYQITQSSLFVGTFNGMLLQFETQTYHCLRRIQTTIAIKHLSLIQNILVLCLQDDYTQLIDLSLNKYVNLTGHNSFTGCAIGLKSTILLGSYDGNISITNPKNIKNWKQLQVKNKILSSFSFQLNQIPVDKKTKLKSQSGIGMGVLLDDLLVFSMYDNAIKTFKVSFDQLQNK